VIGWWAVTVSFASVARLEPPCADLGGIVREPHTQDCASRLVDRGMPHAARSIVVQQALRGPGPGYREALTWLVDHEQGAPLAMDRGPSDALEAVASGTDPQTWPTELRSTLAFHRARWLARNGHPNRAVRLLQGDTTQRALLLTGTLMGQSASESDRTAAVRMLARAARAPDGDSDNRDLALVNAGRVLLSLDRPDLAWALFAEVDPDAAHGRAASRGALWCEVALGYGDLVQQRLDQLGTPDAETLYLSGVLAAHEGRIADAQAARDALVAIVEAEASIADTVAGLRGTIAWAAWEQLRPVAPASLQAHVDDRAAVDGGVRTLDEVVAEFEHNRHRPDVGHALRADLAQGMDRLGTRVAGAAAERRKWRDAANHLSALLAQADASHQASSAEPASGEPLHPLRASTGQWGAPADVADGTYAGPLPTPRTPDRVSSDARLFGDPEPEPGHAGLSAQGGPHPWIPGHHLLRLTVAAPVGAGRQGVDLGVAFDRGSVVSVRRVGDGEPSMEAVGALRAGDRDSGAGRATVLFDVQLADVPGDTLATVTMTGRRRGGQAQTWTFPLPVALVNPLEDAGDRRHLLIAAVAGGVGERVAGGGATRWDVLGTDAQGRPGDVAALMEVIGDLRESESPISSISWDEASSR
jgi:hypothetical protein